MNEKHTPQEIAALKQEILSSLHCALPGMVVAFDAERQTADIRLAKKGLPVLRGVPVFLPASFEIREGDACLVVFADHDIDAWLDSGEDGEPASGRTHSLSDGFAFVGFYSGAASGRNSAE